MFCILLCISVRYVFLLLCLCILIVCMFCFVYSVSIVPNGILWHPWLRFFHAFSSVVRQMPGYNSQRQGMVRTLPNWWIVLIYVLFVSIVLYVLFVFKCVLYYCHWVATQWQLNKSYIITIMQHRTTDGTTTAWGPPYYMTFTVNALNVFIHKSRDCETPYTI